MPPIELLHRDVDGAGQVAARVLLGRSDVQQPRAGRHQLARVAALDLAAAPEDEVDRGREHDGDGGQRQRYAHPFTRRLTMAWMLPDPSLSLKTRAQLAARLMLKK